MAAITFATLQSRRDAVMKAYPAVVLLNTLAGVPVTDDATAGAYFVKETRGAAAVSAADARGNALDGWKSYTAANLATAYSL